MPNSLKTMIKKLAHKGRISSVERDELLMKLEGHDKAIRAEERAYVIDKIINYNYESETGFITVAKGALINLKENENESDRFMRYFGTQL